MDIKAARQSINDYLGKEPQYSGDIEETNNGFQITISKHTHIKSRPGRESEEIEIHPQTISRQAFENLTLRNLNKIIEELMAKFNQN